MKKKIHQLLYIVFVLTDLNNAEISNGSSLIENPVGRLPTLCDDGSVLPYAEIGSTAAFSRASLASGRDAVTLLSAAKEGK